MTLAAVSGYTIVVSIHVMAAIAAFGLLFAYPLLLLAARRSTPDPAAVHEALERAHRLLVTPAAVIVLAAGIYLAADADVFDRVWVTVPLVIIIVLLGLIGAYFIPREKRLATLASQRDDNYARVSRQVATMGVAAAVLVLIATFLMVAKP
jgi:uncharacterized membrane protein